MTSKFVGSLIWAITETWAAGDAKEMTMAQLAEQVVVFGSGGEAPLSVRTAQHAVQER